MDNKYIPIEGEEVTDLQFFHSLYRCLKDSESLKPRFQSIGKWWRWRGIIKQLHNLFGELWNTIDPEKRERINAVWSNQELRIVNISQAVDPTGDLMMVPKSSVTQMAKQLQKNDCSICFGGHNDRKNCMFRRAMIDLAIPDLRREEKRSGKCVGHIYDWGN